MMIRVGQSLATLMIVLISGPASACPLCASSTGEQVRAGIVNGDFANQAGAMLLPFAVMLAIVAVIHHGPLNGQGARTETQRHADTRNDEGVQQRSNFGSHAE